MRSKETGWSEEVGIEKKRKWKMENFGCIERTVCGGQCEGVNGQEAERK